MLLELAEYNRQSKKESTDYLWRIKSELREKIAEVAAENKVFPSVVMRYIINWACDKMDSDDNFREHMLEISIKRNDLKGDNKRYLYSISKNTNDKLQETNKKYRIHNINFFVAESVKFFFEEHE